MSQDVGSYEDRARKPLGENAWNKLTDKQKAALTSYAYNTGSIGTLLKAGLKEAILEGNTKKAAKIIEDYGVKTSKGKYMKVLEERRKREASLFASENIKQDLKQPASLPEGGKKLATTAVVRGRIKDNQFVDQQEVFEGLPYASTRHHYGSRLVFDKKGYLFISMGERGQEKVFPQDITTSPGKIHRINDDGTIPADNPFAKDATAKRSEEHHV